MIILDLHGHYSLLPKMKPIMLLRDFPKLFKMRRIVAYLPLSQIMGESSRAVGNTISSGLPTEWRVLRNLSMDNIIGQVQKGVSTRRSLNHFCEHMAFVSQVKPKTIADALGDNNWINAMHEELNQFTKNEVWTPVLITEQKNVIGTKWVFKNKLGEQGTIVRNKARLVAKGYNQEE